MRIILSLYLIFCSILCCCQYTCDLSLLKNKFDPTKVDTVHYKTGHMHIGSNEIEFLLAKSFLFYKNFISSQDISSCNFTPSCSEYALQAIRAQGTFTGIINFFDRFTRCNGLNSENYPLSKDKKLLNDPVRDMRGEILYEE